MYVACDLLEEAYSFERFYTKKCAAGADNKTNNNTYLQFISSTTKAL